MIQTLVLDSNTIVHTGFEKIAKDSNQISLAPPAYLYNPAFKISTQYPIDIIVMDMELQGISPVTLIEKIREEYPQIKIIVFSNQPSKVYSISLLKAGATAYLSKKTNSELLLEAINYVYNKGFYVTSRRCTQLNYNINLEDPKTNFETLSPREIEVLKLLVEGTKNIDIAEKLDINQKTVNTYKTRILTKLNVDNSFDLYLHSKQLRII